MSCKISCEEAREAILNRTMTAVDVREPAEYAEGHLPHAVLLPLGSIRQRAAEVIPQKDAPWIVYCRSGHRAAEAVRRLEEMGYTRLYDMGGILDWHYEISKT